MVFLLFDKLRLQRHEHKTTTRNTGIQLRFTWDGRECNESSFSTFHEHLVASTKAEHEVEGRLLLDVVVRQGAPILELLASEDQTLLVGGDALLVLDLGLDVLDRVGGLDLEGDGLAGQGLHEDLHASTKAEHEVEGRLLLDVVVRQGAPILELLASEDQTLLV